MQLPLCTITPSPNYFYNCPSFVATGVRHLCSKRCFYLYHHPYRIVSQFYNSVAQRARVLYCDVDESFVDELLGGWSLIMNLDPISETFTVPKITFLSPSGSAHSTMLTAVKIIFDQHTNAKNASMINAIVRNTQSWETNINREKHQDLLGSPLYPSNFTNDIISPFGLIEEVTVSMSVWHLLLSCIFLNRTSRAQIDGVLFDFLDIWPSPAHVVNGWWDGDDDEVDDDADVTSSPEGMLAGGGKQMREVVRQLGLRNRRSCNVYNFTSDYLSLVESQPPEEWSADVVAGMRGVGPYAVEAFQLFVRNNLDSPNRSGDKYLNDYRTWRLNKVDTTMNID